MKVLKFGGSSVGSPACIEKVIEIAIEAQKTEKSAVVVSAFQGVTDQLINMSQLASTGREEYRQLLQQLGDRHIAAVHELIPAKFQSPVLTGIKVWLNDLEDVLHGVFLVWELSTRTLDFIMSFGELFSAYILAHASQAHGIEAEFLDARKIIKTDENYGAARVDFAATNEKITSYFREHQKLQVITGFIASTSREETITLGRGGSDYTASIVGAALDASVIEIWTDVDGVMTADPRKVAKAFPLQAMSYEEAMELSHFGAKVVYPPTMQPALEKHIPLSIRNTFNPAFPGTLIQHESAPNIHYVTGISSINDIALLRIQGSGMIGVVGVAHRVFAALARRAINVILITQASSEHTICIAVAPALAEIAKREIEQEFNLEIKAKLVNEVLVERDLAVVSVVGANMSKRPGISGRVFNALGKNGINIAAIAQGSSELNISAVIAKADEAKALNAIHDGFFLAGTRTLNVFLVGTGLIGKTLLSQIGAQTPQLRDQLALDFRLIGVTNTSRLLLDEQGLDTSSAQETLAQAEQAGGAEALIERMEQMNLPNSVLVDCTASDQTVAFYRRILDRSISIVTPNKRTITGPYSQYQELKRTAQKRHAEFLYETCVGAGLPVINTLNDLLRSGDQVLKIEAILSGTLSFIFNTVSNEKPFSAVVQEAKQRGYTEPDPREDLNGLDVARKLLILARECGLPLELKDIAVENLVPECCRGAGSADEFMATLPEADASFEEHRGAAERSGKKLRYIGTIAEGKAQVALEAVDAAHPFYSLSGSDNIISFTTKRYFDRPLVVKGPGAGAEVTAAGVFADVIRIAGRVE